jgi:hypothetical protein
MVAARSPGEDLGSRIDIRLTAARGAVCQIKLPITERDPRAGKVTRGWRSPPVGRLESNAFRGMCSHIRDQASG